MDEKKGMQKIRVYGYNVCVIKEGKNYQYILEHEERPIFRFTHRDAPSLLNPTSKIVQGMAKKMEGVTTKTMEGDLVKVTLGDIVDKLMTTMGNLDEAIIAYEEHKDELEAEAQAEEYDKKLEELSSESDKFMEFLEEKGANVVQYLWYVSEWLAGGESVNIMTGILCHLSTYFFINPVMFFALGRANEGKTVIDEASLTLMPRDAVMNGRVSSSALHRKALDEGMDYPDGRIFKMGDLGGEKDFEKWRDTIDRYKELVSDGESVIELTGDGIDENTGERKIIKFKITGHPSMTMTSVNTEHFDDQLLSRGVTVSPRATNEEVYWFFYYNKGKFAQQRDYITKEEIKGLHNYVEYTRYMYKDARVINPYWTCLETWFHSSEFYKRALSLYPGLVDAVTILNSYNRESVMVGDQLYFVSTKEDNQIVADVFNPNAGLSEPAVRLFNKLLEWYNPFVQEELDDYHRGELPIKECKTIFSVGQIRHKSLKSKELKGLKYGDILFSLVSNGFIESVDKLNRSNENIYVLSHFEKLESTNIIFDGDRIKKYVKDLEGIYGVPPGHLFEIVDQQNNENPKLPFDCDLKLPPWSSKGASRCLEGASRCLKTEKSASQVPQECLKVPQNKENKVINHDKSKAVDKVMNEWGAFI